MKQIEKYFPNLTETQRQQLAALDALYREWNAKINVISRKDIDNLYEHHVLHSLAIAKLVSFRPGTRVLDLGTGGGFPGIPLAIMFPECSFKLIDGTGKKVLVASEVARAIGLQNCVCEQRRGENEKGTYDFVVSRAVMPLPDLLRLVRKNVRPSRINALPGGVICLKGGNVTDETATCRHIAEVTPVSNWFTEDWFREKYIIYVPA